MKNIFKKVSALVIYYCVILSLLYLFAFYLLKNNVIVNFWPINFFQKYEYFGSGNIPGSRKIWQLDLNCVDRDSDLIYKPKIGICSFSNPEFSTELTFTENGRINPNKRPESSPSHNDANHSNIVILGSSHAMGWGVNDGQVFSSLLENNLGANLYNLAVSGYSIRNEFDMFKKSKLLNSTSIIIIHYGSMNIKYSIDEVNDNNKSVKIEAENTYNEQLNKLSLLDKGQFEGTFNKRLLQTQTRIKLALLEPLRALNIIKGGYYDKYINFDYHYKYFITILNKYQDIIKDKKIIVFYSNDHGVKFKNFPIGRDINNKNLYFFDPNLGIEDYYPLDGHLNPSGHKKLAIGLSDYIKKMEWINEQKF